MAMLTVVQIDYLCDSGDPLWRESTSVDPDLALLFA